MHTLNTLVSGVIRQSPLQLNSPYSWAINDRYGMLIPIPNLSKDQAYVLEDSAFL